MYSLTYVKSDALKHQTRVGIYGSDNFHTKNYLNCWEDIEVFCRPLKCKLSIGGFYYRKKDALMAAKNLEQYSFGGGMFLKGKTGDNVYCQITKITKINR